MLTSFSKVHLKLPSFYVAHSCEDQIQTAIKFVSVIDNLCKGNTLLFIIPG